MRWASTKKISVDQIRISNLRCFVDTDWVDIAPITVLIGENSSGKSTFMSSVRLAWDVNFGRSALDFNEEPFALGAFDQIARYVGGRGGRAKTFELGLRIGSERNPFTYTAKFGKEGSQPNIISQSLNYPEGSTSIELENETREYRINFRSRQTDLFDFALKESRVPRFVDRFEWDFLGYEISRHSRVTDRKDSRVDRKNEMDFRRAVSRGRKRAGVRPYAFAPVRTKPKRTYDPAREIPDPEGEHIPMLLARTFFTDESRWTDLKFSLDEFGKDSGLFDSLEIKSLGKSESDPFQVRVRLGGPPSNLIDVGYGVSQILPLVVEAIANKKRQTFLMQQPEVHLHPKAQAALGTYFSKLAKRNNTTFIIETHSDYLVDRLRMAVRDGVLKKKDVSLLYFQRCSNEASIHPIKLDDQGNIVDPPSGYRDFFLSEERKILGI